MTDLRGETEHETVIPVVVETIRVDKRVVETGRAVVHTTVSERDEVVEALLERNDVAVERVQIGRVIEAPPAARQEGDTWVFPVLEERVVVVKQLVLKEELRVRVVSSRVAFEQTVRLREEHAAVSVENAPLAGEHQPEAGS